MGNFFHRNRGLLSFTLVVAGSVGLIAPVLLQPSTTLTDVLRRLFNFADIVPFIYSWILLLSITAFLYNGIVAYRYRNRPISAISTKITVEILNDNGKVVSIDRVQYLRANQPLVTAYFTQHSPTFPGGKIKGDSFRINSKTCSGRKVKGKLRLFGDDSRGYEAIQIFHKPLPYRWYLPLVPDWFLRRHPETLPKFISSKIIIKQVYIEVENDYNVENPVYQLTTAIFPQKNVEIDVVFSKNCAPKPSKIECLRIQTNGVRSIQPAAKVVGDKEVFSFMFKSLQNEKVRIIWTNPHAKFRKV